MSEQEFKSYKLVSIAVPSNNMLATLRDIAASNVRTDNIRSKNTLLDKLRQAKNYGN